MSGTSAEAGESCRLCSIVSVAFSFTGHGAWYLDFFLAWSQEHQRKRRSSYGGGVIAHRPSADRGLDNEERASRQRHLIRNRICREGSSQSRCKGKRRCESQAQGDRTGSRRQAESRVKPIRVLCVGVGLPHVGVRVLL